MIPPRKFGWNAFAIPLATFRLVLTRNCSATKFDTTKERVRALSPWENGQIRTACSCIYSRGGHHSLETEGNFVHYPSSFREFLRGTCLKTKAAKSRASDIVMSSAWKVFARRCVGPYPYPCARGSTPSLIWLSRSTPLRTDYGPLKPIHGITE